jgi:hypothetical protein
MDNHFPREPFRVIELRFGTLTAADIDERIRQDPANAGQFKSLPSADAVNDRGYQYHTLQSRVHLLKTPIHTLCQTPNTELAVMNHTTGVVVYMPRMSEAMRYQALGMMNETLGTVQQVVAPPAPAPLMVQQQVQALPPPTALPTQPAAPPIGAITISLQALFNVVVILGLVTAAVAFGMRTEIRGTVSTMGNTVAVKPEGGVSVGAKPEGGVSMGDLLAVVDKITTGFHTVNSAVKADIVSVNTATAQNSNEIKKNADRIGHNEEWIGQNTDRIYVLELKAADEDRKRNTDRIHVLELKAADEDRKRKRTAPRLAATPNEEAGNSLALRKDGSNMNDEADEKWTGITVSKAPSDTATEPRDKKAPINKEKAPSGQEMPPSGTVDILWISVYVISSLILLFSTVSCLNAFAATSARIEKSRKRR